MDMTLSLSLQRIAKHMRTALLLSIVSLGLLACNNEDSTSVSSGGGTSIESDGGKNSKQYAGTYNGQIVGQAHASGVGDSDFSEPVSVVIDDKGTVSLTVSGDTVSGVINGAQMEARIKMRIERQWGSCDARITIVGTVNGRRLNGPISGDGDCRYLGIPRNATLTGEFTSTKTQ